jgi:hypothetical protein
MRSKSQAGSYLALVPSSTRMPRRTHRGWPDTILYNINKVVGYRPIRRHTKLLSLVIPYISYASVHFKCLFIQTQPTQALIDIGGGYHLGPTLIRTQLLYVSAQSWNNINIIKWNPTQGGCKVLTLVQGRRKVGFIKAWCVLQTSGVSTYVVWCMKLCKVQGKYGKSDTAIPL